ncbi:MAG: PAS domain-containing protein, partial [Calothrix sp. SM1_7_51]|nr:PAS domain-containing protein [Calothrix sp. SM1_7_51]
MTYLILVVDDDQLVRMQLRELLSAVGYQVAEARNGEEALSIFTRLNPDMVLLDAMMPIMDGFTCCAQLQTLPHGSSTPVLMITALNDPELVERAFFVGATDFITKPVHWSVLRQRVKRILHTSELMKELRSQTQQAQTQSAQLRIALSAARMGVWEWDIVKNKVNWSENKEYLYGLEKGGFDGKYETFMSFVHPEDREKVEQVVIKAIECDAEYDLEFRVVLGDGSQRWMVSKGDIFRDRDGVAVLFSGVDIDITKRKKAEDALKESEERWQLCVAGTNDGIWDWNLVTNEVFFSKRWKEMLGFSEQEISNNFHEWSNRVHEDDIKLVMQLRQEHFEKKTPFYISEYRLCCKDGSYKWILDRGQALWDNLGNVVRMSGSHTDITERKQAEEQLRLSEERFHMVARATNDAV